MRTRQSVRERLEAAEATLEAIRTGQVDALVVSGPRGERTLTLEGATHPYFVLLNAMSDGGALLDHRGAILFANRGLGLITHEAPRNLRGSAFFRLVVPAQCKQVAAFLKAGARRKVSREFLLKGGNGSATPVMIALSPLLIDGPPASPRQSRSLRMAIVTDLSSRKQAEATRTGLLERVISAEDDERRRIARELHDEAGQALTALLVGLRSITDMPLPRPARPIAVRLRRLAAQTVDEVGRVARGLHPAVLDDTGLATAARRYVRDYTRTFGIAAELSSRRVDSPRLSAVAAATTYRILQEALTNVAKHARARHVAVTLKRTAAWLELTVRDDGIGFDSSADSVRRLGLHGMRERATLLGGTIAIESRPRGGTTVRARLPARRDTHR
jgi:signal transduction histidine kinase